MRDAPHGRCAKCGGPLMPDGGVTDDDGQEIHAMCSITDYGDPDMNPEARQR